MDKTVLVDADLTDGREFIDLLEHADMRIDAALWQRDAIFDELHLVIITPEVERLGTKGVYSRMDEILSSAASPPKMDLLDVSVFTTESAFYKSLKSGSKGVANRAVSRQPVGNHVLDDGFIYFVR